MLQCPLLRITCALCWVMFAVPASASQWTECANISVTETSIRACTDMLSEAEQPPANRAMAYGNRRFGL